MSGRDSLNMTHEERMTETLGNTVSAQELADARKQAQVMFEDEATRDFNEKWGEVLAEAEIEGIKRIIAQLPKLSPAKLSENEQISMLAVIALKLGLHDAAELVKKFVETDPNFSWDDIRGAI